MFTGINEGMNKPSCFVATIDLALTDKLRSDLEEKGFDLTQPPYTVFSARKEGLTCTLYTSGKLTVQGKGQSDFITFYLEPEILKNLSYSHPEIDVDFTPRIGIDEAGKGDFFGPLCIAGVFANEETLKELLKIGVRDSKQIGDKAIVPLASKIRSLCPHSLVLLYPKKYNELYGKFHNLNRLLAWAHATAIEELVKQTDCHNVTIDQFGDESLVINAVKSKKLTIELAQQHKGEADPVIAAASILARAAFLDGLQKLGKSIGDELPKGASAAVVKSGRALVARHGEAVLETVAKLHFKTYKDVTGHD